MKYYTKYREIIEENQEKYKQDYKKYTKDKIRPYEEGKKKVFLNSNFLDQEE